ncbi:MAG TPA: right-handed parallel beta-helix repeat-containing protein [Thermoanaerobaculia bacterium]|nr:right-handed parallel beta-helix repeat-containing protein [Thermoanaerobaculia bacterium]
MSKYYMGLVCLLIAVVAGAAEIPERPAASRPIRGVTVNCNNGQSIQAAVDASSAPAEIQIMGICVENVLIRNKDISLRGVQKPSLDGIRSATASMPALTVRGSVIAAISDLSFSGNPGTGVAIRGGADMTLANCLFENNAASGLRVDSGAFVVGNDLTFTANRGTSTNTSDAQFFCIACDISGSGPAVVSSRGAIVSLLDSVVTGRLGIIASDRGSFADIDCATFDTPHACSMNVSQFAALGVAGGTAVLFGAGEFSGQLIADDRGTVRLDGALQKATSSDDQPNIADSLGEIVVAPLFDVTPPAQSLLRDTEAARFARVLLTGDSILKGSIQCTGAADAFLDPTVIPVPGSTVSGCEHASVP